MHLAKGQIDTLPTPVETETSRKRSASAVIGANDEAGPSGNFFTVREKSGPTKLVSQGGGRTGVRSGPRDQVLRIRGVRPILDSGEIPGERKKWLLVASFPSNQAPPDSRVQEGSRAG